MEVGRVGDLRIRDGSIGRLPLVGDRLYRWPKQKPFQEGKMEAICASFWSAVGCTNGTTKKNGLTRAGLLMEVADHTDIVTPTRFRPCCYWQWCDDER